MAINGEIAFDSLRTNAISGIVLRQFVPRNTPRPMGARLLFWTWFAVAVLFGIAAAADILGNGPQAYFGGVLTGAAYLMAHKLTFRPAKISGGDEAKLAPTAERDHPTLASVRRERVDICAVQEKDSTASKRKAGARRSRSSARDPESGSMLDRLKNLLRRLR